MLSLNSITYYPGFLSTFLFWEPGIWAADIQNFLSMQSNHILHALLLQVSDLVPHIIVRVHPLHKEVVNFFKIDGNKAGEGKFGWGGSRNGGQSYDTEVFPGFDNFCMWHTYVCLSYRYIRVAAFLHTFTYALFLFI